MNNFLFIYTVLKMYWNVKLKKTIFKLFISNIKFLVFNKILITRI